MMALVIANGGHPTAGGPPRGGRLAQVAWFALVGAGAVVTAFVDAASARAGAIVLPWPCWPPLLPWLLWLPLAGFAALAVALCRGRRRCHRPALLAAACALVVTSLFALGRTTPWPPTVVLVLWLAATYLVPLWSRRWIGPTIVAGAGSALFLTLVALGPARAPASWLGVACAVLVANGLGLWSAARVEQLQRLERAHVASERKYRRLVEGANSAIVHFDTHGVIRFANGYCQRFFGYDEDELVGHNLMGTIVPPSPTFSADMDRLMQDVQQQPDKYLVSESENMRKDGRRVWLSWSNRAIRDERGQLIEILSVGHDITPRKELERELRRLATSDPLTGAANRRRIVDRATRELQRSRRYDRPLSLLMLDIDHFKRINDRHGHDVGDRVLVRFVEACSAELREDDIIARIGGEEFAVLLPEADLETANAVGERLRATAAEIRIDEPVVRITVSVGVADFGDADEDCQGAFKRADEALYRAKEQGRDRVVAATSAHGQRS